MIHSLRHKVYRALDVNGNQTRGNLSVKIILMSLIFLNLGGQIAATDPGCTPGIQLLLEILRFASCWLFLLEWLARLWSQPESQHEPYSLRSFLKFVFSPLMLTDALAILPFFIPGQGLWDLRFLRCLRLFQLALAFKVVRQSESVKSILHVLKVKKVDVLMTVCVALAVLIVGSGLMYYLERDAQPALFGTLPESLWWGVVTISTIGYGDVHPITPMGKFLAGIMAFCAIGIIALPAGVFGSILAEDIRRIHHHKQHCPHCGQWIDPDPQKD